MGIQEKGKGPTNPKTKSPTYRASQKRGSHKLDPSKGPGAATGPARVLPMKMIKPRRSKPIPKSVLGKSKRAFNRMKGRRK